MEYLDAGEPFANSQNIGKKITTLAININLSFYTENVENRTL